MQTHIEADGPTGFVDMTDQGQVDFAAFVSASPTSIVWSTSDGNQVVAASFTGDIAAPGGVPTAGTINAIGVTDGTGNILFSVSGLAVDLVDITGQNNLESFWRAILADETTVFAPDASDGSNPVVRGMLGAGDFVTVSGESVTGADDTYDGKGGQDGPEPGSFSFYGDAVLVASGQLAGGDDSISARTPGRYAGDAGTNQGTLIGGDDTIFGTASAGSLFIAGDVASNSGDVTGGADVITLGGFTSDNGRATIAGDVTATAAGTVNGGNDVIYVNGPSTTTSGDVGTVSGGTVFAGADTIYCGAGSNIVYGDFQSQSGGLVTTDASHTGNDVIYGGSSRDGLYGQVGDDVLYGNGGDDSIHGDDGKDYIDGGSGSDGMAGGSGNDTYIIDSTGDRLTEQDGGGEDLVESSITFVLKDFFEDLTLTGSANINGTGNSADNVLVGNAGNNKLIGLGGNDTLNGGVGADTMEGGEGNDGYVVDNVGDKTLEADIAGSVDLVESSVSFSIASQFVENLTLTGSAAINATGNSLNNVLLGNTAANTLVGALGNDTVNGGAGVDRMEGGGGNDTYVVDNAGDQVIEANIGGSVDLVQSSVTFSIASQFVENLTLTGSAAANATGNSLNNILLGNAGANTLVGALGNDTLNGGSGADTMEGGGGNDTYVVDNLGDQVVEANIGASTDTVQSSVSFSIASQFVENLTLTGSGNTNATGNNLANVIRGNTGQNTIKGAAGADDLFAGADNVRDTFVYTAQSDSGTTETTFDQIFEFDRSLGPTDTTSDLIDLSAIDANPGAGGDQQLRFVTSFSSPQAGENPGQVRVVDAGVHVNVEIDFNGDNVRDSVIQVTNVDLLTINDFVL